MLQQVERWIKEDGDFFAFEAAIAYYHAYQWFNNADDVWKYMIGHSTVGPDPNGIGYCEGLDSYIRQTECMVNGGIAWYPNIVKILKPSDGVVLAESAKSFPGLRPGGPLQGSNHFQMRNDSQLKLRLKGAL